MNVQLTLRAAEGEWPRLPSGDPTPPPGHPPQHNPNRQPPPRDEHAENEEMAKQRRIHRERAQHDAGFPVAGHDRGRRRSILNDDG